MKVRTKIAVAGLALVAALPGCGGGGATHPAGEEKTLRAAMRTADNSQYDIDLLVRTADTPTKWEALKKATVRDLECQTEAEGELDMTMCSIAFSNATSWDKS